MTTVCRFCHTSIEVPLPEDERMERCVRQLATRACCNKCADYQRAQRSRGDLLSKLGISWQHSRDESERSALLGAAKLLMQGVVRAAEKHHLLEVGSLAEGLPDWERMFQEQPDLARWQSEEFVRRAAEVQPAYAY